MHCPFCGAHDTKVIDSRLVAEGDQVRRRRECLACQERFTTFETAELVLPRIIKGDGRRQPFDEEKLRAGMQRALEKRPVSVEQIEAGIGHIKHRLRATGEREVPAMVVGEMVMNELKHRGTEDILIAVVDDLKGPGGHRSGVPQDAGPDLHRAPNPLLAVVRVLEETQDHRRGAEADLHGDRCERCLRRSGGV